MKKKNSPLSIDKGLDTMMVIAAAHKSAQRKRTIFIDTVNQYKKSSLK